jgi:hypothetical protein
MEIKPATPQIPKGAKKLDVPFTGPILQDEVIGHMPADGFGVLMTDSLGGDVDVVRPQPVLGTDGKPQFGPQVAHLNVAPYSEMKRGLIGGAIGAGALGLAGAVVGYLTGNVGLGAGLGVLAGGAGGALIGAQQVKGDRVSLEWQPTSVVRYAFNGYDHSAMPQTTYQQIGKVSVPVTTGYWHTYTARVSTTPVGDQQYWAPVVKHSADS